VQHTVWYPYEQLSPGRRRGRGFLPCGRCDAKGPGLAGDQGGFRPSRQQLLIGVFLTLGAVGLVALAVLLVTYFMI
jgi:hypothetical protein